MREVLDFLFKGVLTWLASAVLILLILSVGIIMKTTLSPVVR
jgi:hypothetical protein